MNEGKIDNSQLHDDYYVRKSDLDDIETLSSIISEDVRAELDQLYNYPNFLTLFERCYLSLTILNSQQNIIGAICFQDSPPGLSGKYDDLHENLWQDWLGESFELQGLPINSNNSLWINFLHIDENYYEEIEHISQRLFQNLYILQPELDGIMFLKRGEVEQLQIIPNIYRIIQAHFMELKSYNPNILKNIIGIGVNSRIFYSPKSHIVQEMEIRMAREEDHDDLADIFNKQSQVLTSQFGQFFIADLIATQNLTRRMNKWSSSEGKAIVGQIGDKAMGLMSISTEIDYNLLHNYFQLDTYSSLIKNDLLSAIHARSQQIKHYQKIQKQKQKKQLYNLIHQQRLKCLKIGQRIILQQFCIERQSDIKMQLANIQNSQIAKTLDIPEFQALLIKWTQGFEIYSPPSIFQEHPHYAKDISSFIMSPSEFLIQTLQLFGLPKNYMKREGHWKDWAKRIIENNLHAQLKRPKKNIKKGVGKKGKNDKKEEQNLRPPKWFDIEPFKEAFNKMISVGAQVRALFKEQIKEKSKKVLMLFCDDKGEMIEQRNVNLNTLGKLMNEHGITISQQVSENMSSMLEAFGNICYYYQVVKIKEKQQEKKTIAKKEQQPKFIDVVEKLVSYKDFQKAISIMENFDVGLARLKFIKSPKLQLEVQAIELKELEQQKQLAEANTRTFNFGKYQETVMNLTQDEFPKIPPQANNAIVINLFCVDKIYESRSLDFVEYAFSLFPDKEYIIITQPFTLPQSFLVRNFIQVPHKKNCTFEHCLYIYHRDSLFSKEIKVRRSQPQDIGRARYLLDQMLNKQTIQATIQKSISEVSSQMYSFTVNCGSELIGIYTISKTVNLDYYISHFFVQDQIILEQHPRTKHAKVIYSFINPLFRKSVRFILKQILRLTNKTCLYFEVHNRTLLPDIFTEFTPLRMRMFPHFLKQKWDFQFQKKDLQRHVRNIGGIDQDRDTFDEQDAPFSLSMVTKKNLNSLKMTNNSRIVIVGASDTGISFIESLLMIKDVHFTNITLLSPGGIMTMHIKDHKDYLKAASTSYTLEELSNLMVDARTTVLDAKMVKLDKKQKRILLDKNAYLAYDILVLSVGLIDTLLQNEGLISCGQASSPYYEKKPYIQGVYSIDDPNIYHCFAQKSKNITLLKRIKKPQNITIYGRTPHTIAFISGLISRGVSPNHIYYVCPGLNRRRTQTFQTNQQKIQYDSQLINDPDTFEDINVEKMVIAELRFVGVHVQLGFEFYEIDGNPCKGVKFRKKADNYEELDDLIRKKRLEIQQKLQEMGNKLGEDIEDDSDDSLEKISPQREIQIMQQKQWKELYTPCAFFITSGLIDIDREIFNIIHENGLVYNGRLIVKSNFQTTENEIFACGRICEFSQRYKNFAIGKSLRLDRYNGRQLGSVLCKHVLQILNLSYLSTQKYTEDQLPTFHMPVGIGSNLFNNMVYYYLKKTEYSMPKIVLEKGIPTQEIISKNIKGCKGHYIRFNIDPNGMIESISYLGDQQIMVPSLMSFIGLSISYLNKILRRNDAGLIPDICEFLSQNWAICLYHQLFSEFRHYMKKSISSKPIAQRLNNRAIEKSSGGGFVNKEFMQEIKGLLPSEILSQIRQGTISFIKHNRNHVPMYYVPNNVPI